MSAAVGVWTAPQLWERFAVYGRFYERCVDGVNYRLRSHLEIFERYVCWPAACLAQADLVAVMMNPGGSRPLCAPDAEGWAKTVPDRTQYQLMRLALAAQQQSLRPIRHIRVINLSDMRTPKSAQLFRLLKYAGEWHSVFDESRKEELRRALGCANVPVLCAWGLSPRLHRLAQQASKALSGHPRLGLSEANSAWRHPLPRRTDLQRAWLAQICEQWARVGRSESCNGEVYT